MLLDNERLRLTMLRTSHAAGLLGLMQSNQTHFAPWDPPLAHDFYTLEFWEKSTQRAQAEATAGTAQRWIVEAKPSEANHAGEIIGTINLSQIARGPSHSAMLGYQISKSHEGKGLMFDALTLAITHAFEALKLHRLQASYVTTNERSARVLQRLGFETIGTAQQYLFINGAWRDHVMTQLINTAFDESAFTH